MRPIDEPQASRGRYDLRHRTHRCVWAKGCPRKPRVQADFGRCAKGIILQAHPWIIAAEGVASIAVLQFVYVAAGLTRHYFQSRAATPQIQSAIRQVLQTELEAPRNLPPELAALVARLQVA
jgi:hypothetical protein